jgi:hypothetical protein
MMNTITIDRNIYQYAEEYAQKHNLSVKELIECALKKIMGMNASLIKDDAKRPSWHNYKVSDEVMALTFKERVDIPDNYDEIYHKAINERCK